MPSVEPGSLPRRRSRSRHGWRARLARRLSIPGARGEQLRFWILLAFLFLCAIGGGGSRADVLSLLYLRPAAVICIAALLLVPGPWDFRSLRDPLLLLAGFAAIMLIQLIPLPPDLWLSLPGRGHYAEAAAAAGVAQPWRPLSLTPDLTLNSLLALLPALAVLIGYAGINEDQRRGLLLLIVVLGCVSALLGIFQLTGRPTGPAFLYAITHRGSAVGLFANRNHEALLLALCFPLLRLWTLAPGVDVERQGLRLWIAAATGLFLVAMILVTGSRAGFAVGAVGVGLAYAIAPARRREGGGGMLARIPRQALWLAPVMLVGLVALLGRAVAIQRLSLLENLAQEERIANLPLMLRITRDFFPFGSGFGSFDPIFRTYEPDSSLTTSYFNHAHNEVIELALTGGVPALTLLIMFLIWWARSAGPAFRPFRGRSQRTLLARGGAVMILLMLLGSLVDYPLRTPLLSALCAIACGWLARPAKPAAPLPVAFE